MTLPNFLIIGAAKTATTSLWKYLRQHPQIYMSASKEPRFFAFEGETLNFRGPGDSEEIAITDLETYSALFNKVTHEIAIGEATTMYLWSPKAPERIRYHIPHTKLIAFLRDPVERAFSNFQHLVQQGREPIQDFSQAIAAEEQRIQEGWWPFWYYKQQGMYSAQLKRYFALFERDQIKIYFYEDFKKTPLNIIQDVFKFLNVDSEFIPDLSQKARKSHPIPKNKALHKFLTQANPIKSMLKPLLPTKMRQQVIAQIQEKNLTKPQLNPEVRRHLIEDYREDILNLQNLLGRDFSQWLE
jgi:hypothetical protein